MIYANRWFSRAAMIILSGVLLTLAGCGGNVRTDVADKALADHHFDTTVEAYKSDQFLLNGAVLSAIDLGSHFAYLKDQGKLPKSVFLERSDASKINKKHRQYMATLSIDYGFAVYYMDGEQLVRIDPTAKNARALQEGGSKLPSTGNEGQTAHDSTYGDVGQQQQQQQQQY